jgi:hypothetical protein
MTGNREAATHLRRRGQVELMILEQDMRYRRLQIGLRRVPLAGGAFIICQHFFGQRIIMVHVPITPTVAEEEQIEELLCWCSACFAEGRITRVIGDYGYRGDYATPYPACCNADDTIGDYEGIRYEVMICQRVTWGPFICIPSDFAEYEVGESVMVLFNGRWSAQPPYSRQAIHCSDCAPCIESAETGCDPCNANRRPGQSGDEPDGTFTVLPVVL